MNIRGDVIYHFPGLFALAKMAHTWLSHVWQQMMNNEFGILSAQTGKDALTNPGRQNNNLKHEELRALLRTMGLGFIQTKGLWINRGLERYIPEDSLFIANIDENTIRFLAEMYGQEAYIYGSGGSFVMRTTDQRTDIMKGKVQDYLRQLTDDEVNKILNYPKFGIDDLPEGASKTKGRYWILDPQRGKMNEEIAKKLKDTQEAIPNMSSEDVVSCVLKGYKVANAKKVTDTIYEWFRDDYHEMFYCFDRDFKYMNVSGIILDNQMDVPGGSVLAAYIPIKEKQ